MEPHFILFERLPSEVNFLIFEEFPQTRGNNDVKFGHGPLLFFENDRRRQPFILVFLEKLVAEPYQLIISLAASARSRPCQFEAVVALNQGSGCRLTGAFDKGELLRAYSAQHQLVVGYDFGLLEQTRVCVLSAECPGETLNLLV